MPDSPPPGWYRDPSISGVQRYWNGREWTSDTQPGDESSQWRWSGPQRVHHRDVVIGWALVVLLAPVGAIMGVRLLKTEERKHGAWMIAVAVTIVVLAIVGALAGG
jgi:hypothetical protein